MLRARARGSPPPHIARFWGTMVGRFLLASLQDLVYPKLVRLLYLVVGRVIEHHLKSPTGGSVLLSTAGSSCFASTAQHIMYNAFNESELEEPCK